MRIVIGRQTVSRLIITFIFGKFFIDALLHIFSWIVFFSKKIFIQFLFDIQNFHRIICSTKIGHKSPKFLYIL